MSVTKKTRFEVFKRDKFTCQYCGKSAPDVVLNADHIQPKSKGGTNDILNLITSCFDCNQGKKARLLSDNTIIKKQKAQLDLLQEQRDQLEMLMEWQKELLNFQGDIVKQIADHWYELVSPYGLSEAGIISLTKLIKKFSAEEVLAAIARAVETFAIIVDGKFTSESIQEAWSKVGMFCVVARRDKENPSLGQIYYIRGILRKRLTYLNETYLMELLRTAVNYNIDLEWLTDFAKRVHSWTVLCNTIEEFISKQREDEK